MTSYEAPGDPQVPPPIMEMPPQELERRLHDMLLAYLPQGNVVEIKPPQGEVVLHPPDPDVAAFDTHLEEDSSLEDSPRPDEQSPTLIGTTWLTDAFSKPMEPDNAWDPNGTEKEPITEPAKSDLEQWFHRIAGPADVVQAAERIAQQQRDSKVAPRVPEITAVIDGGVVSFGIDVPALIAAGAITIDAKDAGWVLEGKPDARRVFYANVLEYVAGQVAPGTEVRDLAVIDRDGEVMSLVEYFQLPGSAENSSLPAYNIPVNGETPQDDKDATAEVVVRKITDKVTRAIEQNGSMTEIIKVRTVGENFLEILRTLNKLHLSFCLTQAGPTMILYAHNSENSEETLLSSSETLSLPLLFEAAARKAKTLQKPSTDNSR